MNPEISPTLGNPPEGPPTRTFPVMKKEGRAVSVLVEAPDR
jgi:hypothetical protein